MRYFIIFFFVSFSFGHLVNGKLDKEDLKYIKHKKVLKVCINPDWAPIEFREQVPKGISIDILNNISKKIGLKIKYIYSNSWFESQEFLKLHKCDITPTAIKTYKREKYAIFTKPYLSYDLAIITSQDKPYVTNIEAILDKTITRKKGSGLITKLEKKYPNIKIVKPDNFKKMFELVNNEKVYATIATLPVFAYYKKRYNLYNLKVAGFLGWKYELRMMINKNEPKLREILDSELQIISPKFTQEIYEKWIVKTKSEFNYKQFLVIIVVIVIILVWLMVWIYILHKKNNELKRLSEIKSQFLSNMSHELRTPLNALMGFVSILKENPKEIDKYLPLIDSSSKLILSEIDDILNFDRFKKEIKLNKKEFKSSELSDITLFCKERANKKGLAFEVDTNLPPVLYGDIDKIRDVIVHLIDNAIKFTHKGKICIQFKYQNHKLYVSIKDTGIGIPNDKLKEIFKEFIQLDLGLNKKYRGIGIGLSIAQKLVMALGGKLEVKSELNKGSEFSFSIPLEVIQPQENEVTIRNKILMVEDNKANQMFLQVILKQLKVNFDIAENGMQAVEMYKEYNYPVILMDINMPVMDGIEATKQIREYENKNHLKSSKIIAVTANAIDGDKERFLSIGIDDYIPKPVDIKLLKKVIIS